MWPEPMDHEAKRQCRPPAPAAGAGLSWLLLLGAGLMACSSGAELESESQRIAGGQADSSHDSVFLLLARTPEGSSLCTATLIAPNLLLTARHCISPGSDEHVLCGASTLGEPYPAGAMYATNDPTPREDSNVFRAIEVRVPTQGTDTCGYDIALVVLSQNVPEAISVPSVPRIDRDVVPGETYTAVGYGVDAAGRPSGRRMQRSNLNVACEPGSCGGGVESTEFLGEDGICSGDSGGPAFDTDDKVVGVVSRGGPDCSTPIYGTVTAWRTFIMDVAAEASGLGHYEAPFWVASGRSDPPGLPAVGGQGGGGADSSVAGAPAGSAGAPDLCSAGDPECPTGPAKLKDSSCSVSQPGSSGPQSGWLLALGGAALALGRRRRQEP